MKKSLITIIAVVAATIGMTGAANAFVIKLGESNLGDSGDATEKAYIKGLANSELDGWDFSKSTGDDSKSWNFVMPDDCEAVYILLKWGGGQNNPVSHQVWYLNENTTFTSPEYIKSNGKIGQGGLSHYDIFCLPKNVPDAGATLALLGLGMLGVGTLRNRMKK